MNHCFNETDITQNLGSQGHKRVLDDVYVSRDGKDASGCGSVDDPCKSIALALYLVHGGGRVHLNGTETERNPFGCENVTHDQNPGILVNKSVTIQSYQATPYVSCAEGFHFQTINPKESNRRVSISLSGIVFEGTPLVFLDCSCVQLVNCTHQEAKTAVSVRAENIPSVHLDIEGPSLFRNNFNCVEILLKNSSSDMALIVTISGTRFLKNGVDGYLSAKGLISIATDARKSARQMRVQISCQNVSCIGNRAPFVVLDLPTSVTKETYNRVQLLNNTVETLSNTKNERLKDSMFISSVRKSSAKFADLRCANNTSNQALRCIKIYALETKVVIENSSFVGQNAMQGKGGGVFIESKLHASLVIIKTSFKKNKANGGGAIYLNRQWYAGSGNLRLILTDVDFTECEATTDGSAILVGKVRELIRRPIRYALYASIKNVNVKNCFTKTSSRYRCGSVCLMLTSGSVTFEEFHWFNSRPDTAGAVFVGATRGKADVKISRSSFIDGGHSNRSVFVEVQALGESKGSVVVANTSMFDIQDRALVISPKYRIKLVNVTTVSCRYGLQISRRWLGHDNITFPVSILIVHSTFKHNVYDISSTIRDPRSVWLKIANTSFLGRPKTQDIKGYAIHFCIPTLNEVKLTGSRASIELDNVFFYSRPASSFSFYFQGKKTLTIRRSVFRDCTSYHREPWNYYDKKKSIYETSTGAITVLSIPDKPWKLGCVQRDAHNDTHPLWWYDTHVIFQDTLFQENAGLIAGAVYVSNGNTTFKNCSFQDNLAIRKTGQVYSAYGTGRMEFNNCTFSSKRKNKILEGWKFGNVAFFYSESEGPVIFQNTSMVSAIAERRSNSVFEISNGGFVHIDHKTTIHCGRGSMLLFENATHFVYTAKRTRFCRLNITVVRYTCRLCYPGYYSLQTGRSNGFAVENSFQCQACPLGATCIKNNMNIAAKENFWGYQVPKTRHTALLKFIPCPKDYCQSPRTQSLVFNSCRGNRSGVLCGQCATGYTESLFSTDCRRTSQCSDNFLWLVMIVFSSGMAAYLFTKPPLLRLLCSRQVLWFIRKKRSGVAREKSCDVDEQRDSGYLKIVFYYYQVADLLIDNSIGDLFHKVSYIYIIISAFNFEVRDISRGIGCPIVGLTAVTKELFLSMAVFATMAIVVLIYCVHVVVNLVRKRGIPSVHHYMAVFLEILLLGYDRLAETSLGLMHCVTIGSERRLFIDGSTLCWQTWQYLLLCYIVVFVVPFIAVLYFGSRKLYNSSISPSGFLAACVFPLPFLAYWFLKHVCTRTRQESAVSPNDREDEVMEVLQAPFRPPNDGDQGTLHWESVLIGRRLILLSFHSFISNAMLRCLFLAVACQLMAIHHIVKSPFRSSTANKIESTSLVVLSILAIINLIKATLLSSGITPEDENKFYIEGMQWFELAVMAILPALLSLLAVFAILSHTARLIVFLIIRAWKCASFSGSTRGSPKQLREPLLNNQGTNIEESS